MNKPKPDQIWERRDHLERLVIVLETVAKKVTYRSLRFPGLDPITISIDTFKTIYRRKKGK